MSTEPPIELDTTVPDTVSPEIPTVSTEPTTSDSTSTTESNVSSHTHPESADTTVQQSTTETAKIYPQRSRKPVERFDPTW